LFLIIGFLGCCLVVLPNLHLIVFNRKMLIDLVLYTTAPNSIVSFSFVSAILQQELVKICAILLQKCHGCQYLLLSIMHFECKSQYRSLLIRQNKQISFVSHNGDHRIWKCDGNKQRNKQTRPQKQTVNKQTLNEQTNKNMIRSLVPRRSSCSSQVTSCSDSNTWGLVYMMRIRVNHSVRKTTHL